MPAQRYPTPREIDQELGGCIIQRPRGAVRYRTVGHGYSRFLGRPVVNLKQINAGIIYSYSVNAELLRMIVIEYPGSKRGWK
jgi:hypothetical protein